MNESKPTLAFVDHSLHERTGSADFLRALLAGHFEISNFSDRYWQTGEKIPVETLNRFDCVFYEQTFCPLEDLAKLKAQIIWTPMYDGVDFRWSFWKRLALAPVKIIGFSEPVTALARKFAIPVLPAKLYLDPALYRRHLPAGRHFFFWHRSSLRFAAIKKIIRPEDIDSFTYRSYPDPSYSPETISDDDRERYKMRIVDGELTREEYLSLLSQSNIFIAPRKREGIGLSFIEALAMGHAVVGWNDATMNQYIKPDESGWLFNAVSGPLNFQNVEKILANANRAAAEGFRRWQASESAIIDFIKTEAGRKKPRPVLAKTLEMLHLAGQSVSDAKRVLSRHRVRLKKFLT